MTYDARAVEHAYEAIAEGYGDTFGDDLEQSAVDRSVLDNAVASLPRSALLIDLGCGPAHVAGSLIARGCRAVGLDLTPAMLEAARRQNMHLPLVRGDLLRLPIHRGAVDGAVAWFSLHNLPRDLLAVALSEVPRVLRSGGLFVMSTHAGEGEALVEHDWRGRREHVAITYYEPDELEFLLANRGFRITDMRSRPPLDHEHAVAKLLVTATAD